MSLMTNRGGFLAATGALIVAATATGVQSIAGAAEVPYGTLGSWLKFLPDGTVELAMGKVEIGMGTTTGLAMIVAEELDVPLSRVRLILGDTDRTPDQGGVGGSTSTETGSIPLRNVAAQARYVLVGAAAKQLGVDAANLTVSDGVVRDPASGKTVSYGELVSALAAAAPMKVTGAGNGVNVVGEGKPKPVSQYKLVGTKVNRLDIDDKVFGRATYVVDLKLPGMVHGRVIRPEHAGVKLVAVDRSSIAGIGDAKVLVIKDFVAVYASKEWDAVRAARQLKVTWSAPQTVYPEQATLESYLWSAPTQTRHTTLASGKVDELDANAHAVEAQYFWPFQAHATMGPGCGVADVKPGSVTAWTGDQKPNALRVGLADLLDVPLDTVHVNFLQDAGSYGRSGLAESAADAAIISRAIGKPVRVQWMRHEMTQWGPKGPAMVSRMRGAVKDGKVTALDIVMRGFNGNEIFSQPSSKGGMISGQFLGYPNVKDGVEYAEYGQSSIRYAIGNVRAISENVPPLIPLKSPLRTTHLRDPEGPQATFAVECFMDELAAAAGVDPVDFRLAHLTDQRAIDVTKAAAKAANWVTRAGTKPGAGPVRTGRGIAIAQRGKTMIATVAEVSVNVTTGVVKVDRLVCAHECGIIVNPNALKGTIEANLVQSMSRALFEEVRFDRTTATSKDWHTYPVAHVRDIPKLEVVMLDRKDLAPTGAGEPSSRPTAAAIANAIADAIGVRVRKAPFTPANVRAALENA
jgi:nicotinate dehydrogenase subunit B